ncbi:hypothetical protein D6D23_06522 [Aureobasidium pullulans]|nr:hypothetical protein D6D23_06522 [Aureobasidium pullulans]
MFIHTNCFCRICAGRNMSTFTGRPVVSPLSPSFHHRVGIDSPPSPLSLSINTRRLSISDGFTLPSPVSPFLMPARDLPLSPITPYNPTSPPWSPSSEYSTDSATSDLSIAELTAGDFPSPSSPYVSEFVWDICVIPSVPCKTSVFAAQWRSDSTCPFTLPAKNGPCERSISPSTLSNGRKAVCSAAAETVAPPLPPRPTAVRGPAPKRPLRSPLLAEKMSWAGPRLSFDAGAGASISSASDSVSAHTIAADQRPLPSNAPWWSTIPAHTYSHSSLSTTSTSVNSSIRKTPSVFYRKSQPTTTPSPATQTINQAEARFLYWDSPSTSAAAEYATIFGIPVDQDDFAWIRYPVPGPHALHCYDDEDVWQSVYDEDDTLDQSAGYGNWHDVNPTAIDASDPFADFDGAFGGGAVSAQSSLFQSNSACSVTSTIPEDVSIHSSSYSGVTTSIRYATTLEAMRASYISGYLSRSAVSAVKEVCTPAYNMSSIDAVVGGMF